MKSKIRSLLLKKKYIYILLTLALIVSTAGYLIIRTNNGVTVVKKHIDFADIQKILPDLKQTEGDSPNYHLTISQFQKYATTIKQQTDNLKLTTSTTVPQDDYLYKDCGTLVDDSDPASNIPGIDKTNCFVSGGEWSEQQVGYNKTSLYSNSFSAIAFYTPDFKHLNGNKEIFVTIPTVPHDTAGQNQLAEKVTYYVMSKTGVDEVEVLVNQQDKEGKLISLGNFDFDGTDAQVFLFGLELQDTGGYKYVVTDLMCFGPCPDGISLDLTPPRISEQKPIQIGSQILIQVKVTDAETGVKSVYISQGTGTGDFKPMHKNDNDIYSLLFDSDPGKIYYVIAYDNADNEAIWSPTLGYISRAAGKGIGIPPEMARFIYYKKTIGNQYLPAQPGMDKCKVCSGDPINTSNGNFIENVELLKVSGRPEIKLDLTYNSQGGGATIFGENWGYSYNYHLMQFNNVDFTGAIVQYPEGHSETYTGTDLQARPQNFDKLTKSDTGYVLLKQDQSKIYFGSNGDVTRIEDINSNGLNFEYTSHTDFINFSKVSKISNDSGRFITLEYNESGLVSKIHAPEDKAITLEYSGDNDLVRIVDANGNVQTFEYQNHAITKRLSGEGHPYYTNTYDDKLRVTKQVSGTSSTQEYSYEDTATTIGDAPKITIVKDGNQKIAKYEFDSDGMMIANYDELGNKTTFEYNDKKEVVAETNAEGQKYEYSYDSNGNQTYQKDPAMDGQASGFETKRTFNDLNKLTSEILRQEDHKAQYEYDSKGNLLKITNANQSVSSFTYDNVGQLTSSTDFNGNVTFYFYNSNGDLESIKNAKGDYQRFSYDGLGRRTKYIDAKGNIYSYNYDKVDNLIKTEGPLGFTQKYAYDKNNRLISETDPSSSGPEGAVTKYSYDNSENLLTVTNQLGNVSKIEYGVMNEKLKEIDANGHATSYAYTPDYKVAKTNPAVGTPSEAQYSYQYNKNKQIVAITDPLNRVTSMQYDALGRPIKEILNNLATTIKEYSPNGVPTAITDANGNKTTYQLDKLDRIVQTQDAEGNATKYEYDSNGNLTKKTDPKGFNTTYEYDQLNQLVKTTDAKDSTNKFEYDANGNLTKTVNALGKSTIYVYDELNRLASKIENPVENNAFLKIATQAPDANNENITTKYEYDLNGNIVSVTDPKGNTTKFEYDAANQNTKIIDAKGNATLIEYDKVGNVIKSIDRNGNATQVSYDELNRRIQEINAENNKVSYGYDKVGNLLALIDPNGNTTKYVYNDLNQQIKKIDPLNATTTYTFDLLNNPTKITDPNNHSTTYAYDKIYRLLKDTDPEGFSQQYSYDPNNNLTEAVDRNGNKTKFSYDELNRVTQILDAKDGKTQYAYDALGNKLSLTDANSHQAQFAYDKLDRLIKTIDAEGNQTKFEYDANSNLTKKIDGNNKPMSYGYDELNRVIKEINALNQTTNYEYDNEGNLTSKVEADNVKTGYNYDKAYRLTDAILNQNSQIKPAVDTNVKTSYSYDPNGNLTSITDPNNHQTKFFYDAMNRQIKEVDANNNTWQYAYDKAGNKTTRMDANGLGTNYLYYPDNQLKAIDYGPRPETGNKMSKISFQYDPNNNKISMKDTLGTSNWSYDALNRTILAKDSLGKELSYNYDAVGNNTGIKYPDGTNVAYEYLKNNWLSKADSTTYERDHVGNVTKVNNSNNTNSIYSYNDIYQVTSITNNAAGKINSSFKYSYNNVGLRTEVQQHYDWRQPEDVNQKYSYDSLRRLTGSVETGKRSITNEYSYDAAGNRLSWVSNDDQATPKPFDKINLDYDYNNINELTKIKPKGGVGNGSDKKSDATVPEQPKFISFEYDNNGNRISKETHGAKGNEDELVKYTYDPEDRLASVQNFKKGNNNDQNSETGASVGRGNLDLTTMKYDGMGRRLLKENKNDKTQYVYNSLDQIAEYNLKNPQYTNYYRGNNNQIISKQDFPSGSNGQQTWFHYDALDSVVGLTKQNGQSDKNYRYDDFGKIIPENGNFTDPHNHYTYTGQEWDENTNLYEFYSRAYDPVTSVWLQQDRYRGQIMDPMSLLRYKYVKNSPINLKDLYGYDWWSDWTSDLSMRVNDFKGGFEAGWKFGLGQISNSPVGLYVGQSIGQADWVADTVIGVAELAKAIDPTTYPQRIIGYATGKGDPIYQDFLKMKATKSKVLSDMFGVGDECYFKDGTTFLDNMFPGLTNLGNLGSNDYNYLEKGYLIGRAEGDAIDIALLVDGLAKGVGKVGSLLSKADSAEEIGKVVATSGDGVMKSVSNITDIGPNIPGTEIPSSFTIATSDSKVKVLDSATKHIEELLTSNPTAAKNTSLSSQLVMEDLEAAIQTATEGKVSLNTKIYIGTWELMFDKPNTISNVDYILYHAVYKP